LLRKITARQRVTVATSVAHFANDTSLTLLPAVLPVLIQEFDLNYAAAGAVVTASVLLMTALQAVTGYFADRWNRITLLRLGLTTLGLGTILTAFSTNFVQLLAFACLAGIGGSFFHPIGYSLLSDAYESENRGKALGFGSASGDMAIPVAFATSGVLVIFFGWRPLFMLWGLIAIIVAVMLPLILREPEKKGFHTNATGNSATKILWTLIPVIIVMGLTAASFRIASTFTTTYLKTFELGIESANLIFALMMCVGAVGSLVGGTLVEKLGEKNMVTAEMITLGGLSITSFFISNVYFLSFIIVMIGFFLLGVWPSFYSVIAKATSLGARAFMYGLLFAVAWSFGSFFPYISGACADLFGIKVVYILIGVLSSLAAFTAYFTFKTQPSMNKPENTVSI